MSDDATSPRTAGDEDDPLRRTARPYDPAGTRPKHDPQDLLPSTDEPLLVGRGVVPDSLFPHGHDGATAGDGTPSPDDDAREPVAAHATDAASAHEAGAPGAVLPAAVAPAALPRRAAARLQFVLGALLAIGAAGLAVAALIAFAPDEQAGPAGPQWSSWRPDGDGKERVMEIANRVGRQYRAESGEQLVAVTGGPLEVAGLPLTVALREPASQGGDIQIEDGKGILYRLCGLGEKCAIASGKPSRERHLLLRREALELALYTFHYVDVDQVVVFMPPPPGKEPDEALFFKRGDLEPQIERPLAQSLAPRTPSVKSVTTSPDSSFVNDLTIETLFNFSLTQGNSDNRAFLVLDPLGSK